MMPHPAESDHAVDLLEGQNLPAIGDAVTTEGIAVDAPQVASSR